jgi:rod shape determining protein RodA
LLKDRVWAHFDLPTFALVVLLVAVGLVMIASTTLHSGENLVQRQAIWLVAGLVLMAIVVAVDYRTWASLAYLIYGGSVVALAYLLAFGRDIAGARSWLEIGPLNFQPAEMAKIATALAMSAFLASRSGTNLGARNLIVLSLLVAAPGVLILLQPDMGTLFPFAPLLGTMALLGGIRARTLVILGVTAMLAIPFAWGYVLKDYQKERVQTFFDPERDPHGAGYQVLQSKIALGSGGLWGKGPFSGTQGQLHFLPAQHTDFIFSVLGEEGGFAASASVLLLYFLLLRRCFTAADSSRDLLGVYVCMGVGTLLATQILFNIGVAAGLLPTAGIALPLMSYGGSSLVSTLIALGLIMNVRMRRFVN